MVFLYTYQADSLRRLSRRFYWLDLGYILNAYIITHPESEGSLHMPLNASFLQGDISAVYQPILLKICEIFVLIWVAN